MLKYKIVMFRILTARISLSIVIFLAVAQGAEAQVRKRVDDLNDFKGSGKTWRMAGDVKADLSKPNVLITSPGSAVLVNLPDKEDRGRDLFTVDEYGDMDLELDYMMARGSNSGIYLHGRYEIQLEDTWGSKRAAASTNGGIYERWDKSRPEGHRGYEGYAPRQNASRAPGLWQHLKVSFQAPRFDENGRKIEPAKMLRVELNGVLIHENVELSGPTRGGIGDEKATGPLRLQGDHGAVAFRNIVLTDFGVARPPEKEMVQPNQVYPILVNASTNVFRSFMDVSDSHRVVHAVSVRGENEVHYTYDTDTGTIIQVWRGGFLDATPMWHNRGDGSSRPLGAVQRFGKPLPAITRLTSPQAAWKNDTTGTGYHPEGYTLNGRDYPVFHYRTNGVVIADAIEPLPLGEGIKREITVQGPAEGLYVRLAEGNAIAEIGKEMYLVDDGSYYIRLEDAGGARPIIRDADGKKELIISAANKLKYSILF